MRHLIQQLLDVLQAVRQEVLAKTNADTPNEDWKHIVWTARVAATKSVAAKYSIQVQSVTDTYRRDLSDAINTADQFDDLIVAWLRDGSDRLETIMRGRGKKDDAGKIDEFFGTVSGQRPGSTRLMTPSLTNDLTILRLKPEHAEGGGDTPSSPAHASDLVARIEQTIRARRGQQQFREALRRHYHDQCAVTGCRIVALLEAAHITTHSGADDHRPENGLLLRGDIHTLFDLDLLGVEPSRLQVQLHPSVREEYGVLENRQLLCSSLLPQSRPELERRYLNFLERLREPI